MCEVAAIPGCHLVKSLYRIPCYCECQAVGAALDSPGEYHNQTVQEGGASGDSQGLQPGFFLRLKVSLRKGWKPCGRPLGGSVALLEEASPRVQLRLELSRTRIPCHYCPVPILGSLGH